MNLRAKFNGNRFSGSEDIVISQSILAYIYIHARNY